MSATIGLFDRCTRRTKSRDGEYRIRCVKGLWSVSGKNRKFVLQEARRYWAQYFNDGEYNDITKDAKTP